MSSIGGVSGGGSNIYNNTTKYKGVKVQVGQNDTPDGQWVKSVVNHRGETVTADSLMALYKNGASKRTNIEMGDEYGRFGKELLVDGKTSKERSLVDRKYTFTDYGYDCFIGDDGLPYMVKEDLERLAEKCDKKGELLTPKLNEILGLERKLPDGSSISIGDSLPFGGSLDDVVQILTVTDKEGNSTAIELNQQKWRNLYRILEDINVKDEYLNKDYWNRQFLTYDPEN